MVYSFSLSNKLNGEISVCSFKNRVRLYINQIIVQQFHTI